MSEAASSLSMQRSPNELGLEFDSFFVAGVASRYDNTEELTELVMNAIIYRLGFPQVTY